MKDSGIWSQIAAAPRDFAQGFLGGLLAPFLALVGAVALLYWLTGQLPAFREVVDDEESRKRVISLAAPLEARATWARYGGDLHGAVLEMRARARSATGSSASS